MQYARGKNRASVQGPNTRRLRTWSRTIATDTGSLSASNPGLQPVCRHGEISNKKTPESPRSTPRAKNRAQCLQNRCLALPGHAKSQCGLPPGPKWPRQAAEDPIAREARSKPIGTKMVYQKEHRRKPTILGFPAKRHTHTQITLPLIRKSKPSGVNMVYPEPCKE